MAENDTDGLLHNDAPTQDPLLGRHGRAGPGRALSSGVIGSVVVWREGVVDGEKDVACFDEVAGVEVGARDAEGGREHGGSVPAGSRIGAALLVVERRAQHGLEGTRGHLDQLSEAGRILQGESPSKDGSTLTTEQAPQGVPFGEIAPERPEEFGPGLDAELLAMVQAVAEAELADAAEPAWGPSRH